MVLPPPCPAYLAGPHAVALLAMPRVAFFCRPDGSDLRALPLPAQPPPELFAELCERFAAEGDPEPEATAYRTVSRRRRGRRPRPTLRELAEKALPPPRGLPLPPPFPPEATDYALKCASTPRARETAAAAAWGSPPATSQRK